MRPRRSPGILILPVLLGAGAGCDALVDSNTTLVTITGDPSVEIDPATFLKARVLDAAGNPIGVEPVICAALPGAMQSYVVTFVDKGPEGESSGDFTLPSSPPTPCSQRVRFDNGVTGHRYVAHIDGYEQAATELVSACSVKPAYAVCADGSSMAPAGNGTCAADTDCFANGCFGKCAEVTKQVYDPTAQTCITNAASPGTVKVCDYQQVPGDRHLVQPGTWAPVPPRWTTPSSLPCGYRTEDGESNLVPVSPFVRVSLSPCQPLDDRGTQSKTRIVVKPAETLGSLACYSEMQVPDPSSDAGTITASTGTFSKFDVVPADGAIAPQQGLPCATVGDVVFEGGLVPGTEYTFSVLAYDTIHLGATHRTTCFATAVANVTVPAKCVPLTPISP